MSDYARLALGEVFATRYRIERLIKAGGMGAVYAATHTETLRKVALKVMRAEMVVDPNMRQRFTKEAQVFARLESAHVVEVLDAGVDQATGIPFLVMELLIGKELGELVTERGRLSPEEVVSYLTQTARALDKAHASGVIHRDLKPENLFLVMRDGEPPIIKVLDFGIARIIEGSQQGLTMAGGTPMYMAPEQTARSSNVGPPTDIWALALTAYTLLVGREYWESSDNLTALYTQILSGPTEPPSQRARLTKGVTLPKAFDAWFFHCLARDVAARPQRASDAIRALGDALGAAAPRTPQLTPQPQPQALAATVQSGPGYAPMHPSAPSAFAYASSPMPMPTPTPPVVPIAPPTQRAGVAPVVPVIPANVSEPARSRRRQAGAPPALLAGLGLAAALAIGFGIYAIAKGGGGGSTPAKPTAGDDTPIDKGDDDDDVDAAVPDQKKEPKAIDPKPIGDPADDPSSSAGALSTVSPAPLPPKTTTTTIQKPPPPPPPPQNCSPGFVNESKRCTCPDGFRSVGAPGKARCVQDDDPGDDPQ